jgi:hypothetical protein
MSFRNTFVTDFIYQAHDDVVGGVPALTEAFRDWTTSLDTTPDERGYGNYSGRIGTSGGSVEELDLIRFQRALEEVALIPFRLVILVESGATIVLNIEARGADTSAHSKSTKQNNKEGED